MFSEYHYAYLIGDVVVGFPIWLVLFYFRKDIRREMLSAGILLGLAAALADPIFWKDYWHPEELDLFRAALGNFFYGFFFGGIASAIYEELFRKHFLRRENRKKHWKRFVLPIGSAGAIAFAVPIKFLEWNSIYALIGSLLLTGSLFLYFRRDLIWDALYSGLFFAIVSFIGFLVYAHALFPGIIEAWWKLENLSGILISGIPLEELLFAFAMGFAVGPAYEFFTGRMFKKS